MTTTSPLDYLPPAPTLTLPRRLTQRRRRRSASSGRAARAGHLRRGGLDGPRPLHAALRRATSELRWPDCSSQSRQRKAACSTLDWHLRSAPRARQLPVHDVPRARPSVAHATATPYRDRLAPRRAERARAGSAVRLAAPRAAGWSALGALRRGRPPRRARRGRAGRERAAGLARRALGRVVGAIALARARRRLARAACASSTGPRTLSAQAVRRARDSRDRRGHEPAAHGRARGLARRAARDAAASSREPRRPAHRRARRGRLDTAREPGAAQGVLAQRLGGLDAGLQMLKTELGAHWRETTVVV